jgi:excinuclease UvrABC ATPase subunit
MRKELSANVEDEDDLQSIFPQVSEIDSLVILDRTVDLVTPMCTQLTYEGLIDEVYGIHNSTYQGKQCRYYETDALFSFRGVGSGPCC